MKNAILKIKWSKREKKVYVVYTQNEALKKDLQVDVLHDGFLSMNKKVMPWAGSCSIKL